MNRIAIAALVIFGAVSGANAAGDAAAGQAKTASCSACHGADGNSMVPTFPKLAGQHANYIEKQLNAFKKGERSDPTMNSMAALLATDQDVADVAAYFASQSVSIGSVTDAESAERGKKIFHGGDKAKGVAACMACHGPNGAGNPAANFPSLKGQQVEYVVKALKDFRSGVRTTDPQKMMRDVAAKMSDQDITDVAQYITALH